MTLICSAATYYFVESPMQKYGHKLSRFLQARFGPDTIPAGPAVTAPDAPAIPAEPANLNVRGSNNGADVALPQGGRRSPGGDRDGRVSGGHPAPVRE